MFLNGVVSAEISVGERQSLIFEKPSNHLPKDIISSALTSSNIKLLVWFGLFQLSSLLCFVFCVLGCCFFFSKVQSLRHSECTSALGSLRCTAEHMLSLARIITPTVTFLNTYLDQSSFQSLLIYLELT